MADGVVGVDGPDGDRVPRDGRLADETGTDDDVRAGPPGPTPPPAEIVGLLEGATSLNVPNAFTFLRVVLVPVVLWLLTLDTDAGAWWALVVFVFAAWTDSVDGWVARRYGRVTRWGQLADPIADKLLVLGALASLALVDAAPWWAVGVIAAREVVVTIVRVRLVAGRGLVVPASIWGKVKTITQIVAVSAYLAPPVPVGLADVLLWVAVVATIASGVTYAVDIGRSIAVLDDGR